MAFTVGHGRSLEWHSSDTVEQRAKADRKCHKEVNISMGLASKASGLFFRAQPEDAVTLTRRVNPFIREDSIYTT